VSRLKHGKDPGMDEYESLNHTKWDCKYHVIFIPKYRRKLLFPQVWHRPADSHPT
jgi:hypothetical protein